MSTEQSVLSIMGKLYPIPIMCLDFVFSDFLTWLRHMSIKAIISEVSHRIGKRLTRVNTPMLVTAAWCRVARVGTNKRSSLRLGRGPEAGWS